MSTVALHEWDIEGRIREQPRYFEIDLSHLYYHTGYRDTAVRLYRVVEALLYAYRIDPILWVQVLGYHNSHYFIVDEEGLAKQFEEEWFANIEKRLGKRDFGDCEPSALKKTVLDFLDRDKDLYALYVDSLDIKHVVLFRRPIKEKRRSAQKALPKT